MLYLRMDRQIVQLPTASEFSVEDDEVEFRDPQGAPVARFFRNDVRDVGPEKLELVSKMFKDECDANPPAEDWDGS